MTALASVFLVLAAVTALGLVVAITWTHFDRLWADNAKAWDSAEEGWASAREGWTAARDAEQRLADLYAATDEQVLARHHTAAAHEGLFPPEALN